jgi:ABC-type branched-subunit amino acid transport system ATPase component
MKHFEPTGSAYSIVGIPRLFLAKTLSGGEKQILAVARR